MVLAVVDRGSIQRTIRSSNSVFSLDLNVRLDKNSVRSFEWSYRGKKFSNICSKTFVICSNFMYGNSLSRQTSLDYVILNAF